MNAKCSGGVTPLHNTAINGYIELVRLLCDHGADIEARTFIGWRPLHSAACFGNISIVKELIEVRNADVNARDDSGRTALSLARDHGIADIAAYLVSLGGVI